MNFDSYSVEAAVSFIKKWEGFRDVAYLCPAGVWTLGWGHTEDVVEGERCTKEQAEVWLRKDLQSVQRRLAPYIDVPVTENQFVALLSLAYNIGVAGLVRKCPKLMLALNAKDYDAAADEFLDITNGGIPGLVRRRGEEAQLMRQG